MRALRQCDSGGGGGGGYGSYLCTRHRRDATVSSAVLRSPRRVAEGGRQSRPIPRSVLVEPKIPLTFGNLYIHILPCGEAFSFRYFSSLEGLYWQRR